MLQHCYRNEMFPGDIPLSGFRLFRSSTVHLYHTRITHVALLSAMILDPTLPKSLELNLYCLYYGTLCFERDIYSTGSSFITNRRRYTDLNAQYFMPRGSMKGANCQHMRDSFVNLIICIFYHALYFMYISKHSLNSLIVLQSS